MLLLPSTSFVTESAHIFEQEEHGTRERQSQYCHHRGGQIEYVTISEVTSRFTFSPLLRVATCESLTLCWESFNPQFIGFFGERREGWLG